LAQFLYYALLFYHLGQVAQLVERGPEKAGVGGSIPSLATNTFNNLATAKNIQKSARVQYANVHQPTLAVVSSKDKHDFPESIFKLCRALRRHLIGG
jgi:hypothetical protein